jgi:hypothetical protein
MSQQTTRSYRAILEEADPDFYQQRRKQPAYEFSNGRRFYEKPDPYAGTGTST